MNDTSTDGRTGTKQRVEWIAGVALRNLGIAETFVPITGIPSAATEVQIVSRGIAIRQTVEGEVLRHVNARAISTAGQARGIAIAVSDLAGRANKP